MVFESSCICGVFGYFEWLGGGGVLRAFGFFGMPFPGGLFVFLVGCGKGTFLSTKQYVRGIFFRGID